MTIEEYERNRGGHPIKVNNPYFKNIIIRTLITSILVFGTLISVKINDNFKEIIDKYVFKTDFKFSSINKIFNKYFFDINLKNNKPVIKNNILNFENASYYKNGISIPVSKEFSVPLINSGIVVFIGEKEEYNKTIIVQQSNGMDVWYGNVENIDVTLYDYVEKGSYIGIANEELYLVFQKNGEFLDYKTVIK